MNSGLIVSNVDLLTVGIAISAIGLLGFVSYFSDRKNATNRNFFVFSLFTMVWGISNYFEYRFQTLSWTLWALRLHLFISTWYSLFIFKLSYGFPQEQVAFPAWYKRIVVPLVAVTSLLTLTSFVFSGISEVAPSGEVTNPDRGPGIALFAGVAFGLLLFSIYVLGKRFIATRGMERRQTLYILIGMSLMLASFLTFNIALPVIFNDLRYIPYAAVFVFPFVVCTAYAVHKHKLFNIREAAIAALTFILCLSAALEVIFSSSISTLALRSAIFLLVLAVSIIMNRFVTTIAEQREKLELANEGQTNLIHIMNHQVKGYLSKSRNIFAEMQSGDYGPMSDETKPLVAEGLRSLSEGVDFVQSVLNGSSAESGMLAYNMLAMDFKKTVEEAANDKKDFAADRGLSFELTIDGGAYPMTGDHVQLKEAVRNLVDNSIHYTHKGGIAIHLAHKDGKALFSIKDTGVGVTAADMPRLFTKGGRGKNSLKINVNSTGYGLAYVKAVIEAHKGRVWVESAGQDKGSTFYIELPLS